MNKRTTGAAAWGPNSPPRAPTADECNKQLAVTLTNASGMTRNYTACWYPQVGGYSALCWIEPEGVGERACFDAWVWHDGEFAIEPTEEPDCIHYCSYRQLMLFALLAKRACKAGQS